MSLKSRPSLNLFLIVPRMRTTWDESGIFTAASSKPALQIRLNHPDLQFLIFDVCKNEAFLRVLFQPPFEFGDFSIVGGPEEFFSM